MSELVPLDTYRRSPIAGAGGGSGRREAEFFNRAELQQILNLYSRMVMAGEWLDYAIGRDERGVEFAIYGRVSPVPLYRVQKLARAGRRGRWQLIARGVVLKTAATLQAVLDLLERRRLKAVEAG